MHHIVHFLETDQGNQKKMCSFKPLAHMGSSTVLQLSGLMLTALQTLVPNRMSLVGSSLTINVMWCHNKQSCAKIPGLRLTTERQHGKCGKSILVKPELSASTAFNTSIYKPLGRKIRIITKLKMAMKVSVL